jgi:hypothetical protein
MKQKGAFEGRDTDFGRCVCDQKRLSVPTSNAEDRAVLDGQHRLEQRRRARELVLAVAYTRTRKAHHVDIFPVTKMNAMTMIDWAGSKSDASSIEPSSLSKNIEGCTGK